MNQLKGVTLMCLLCVPMPSHKSGPSPNRNLPAPALKLKSGTKQRLAKRLNQSHTSVIDVCVAIRIAPTLAETLALMTTIRHPPCQTLFLAPAGLLQR